MNKNTHFCVLKRRPMLSERARDRLFISTDGDAGRPDDGVDAAAPADVRDTGVFGPPPFADAPLSEAEEPRFVDGLGESMP